MPMATWRRIASLLLVFVGAFMLVRGSYYAVAHGLGWQGIFVSSVIGALVIALGIARWRYWQER